MQPMTRQAPCSSQSLLCASTHEGARAHRYYEGRNQICTIETPISCSELQMVAPLPVRAPPSSCSCANVTTTDEPSSRRHALQTIPAWRRASCRQAKSSSGRQAWPRPQERSSAPPRSTYGLAVRSWGGKQVLSSPLWCLQACYAQVNSGGPLCVLLTQDLASQAACTDIGILLATYLPPSTGDTASGSFWGADRPVTHSLQPAPRPASHLTIQHKLRALL